MNKKRISEKIIPKTRLFVLTIATICWGVGLFADKACRPIFTDICLALLAMQFALQAVEIHLKGKKEDIKDEE